MDDERQRLAKTYRDLDGSSLLALYHKREDLSPDAADVLRDELKLRGIDPDSLKPTIPPARPDTEPAENEEGDAALADGGEVVPPEVPEELKGEFDPTGSMMLCPSCGAPNHPDEERCRSCRAALPAAHAAESGDDNASGEEQGMAGENPGTVEGQAVKMTEPGTLASAAFGLMGVAGVVFGGYLWIKDPAAASFAIATTLVGTACLGIGGALYRRSSSSSPTNTTPIQPR